MTYDTIASPTPGDFTDCADTVSTDTAAVAAGAVLYFLGRGGNVCGEGSLGTDSNAAERVGLDCP